MIDSALIDASRRMPGNRPQEDPAIIPLAQEINASIERLQAQVKKFETEVWFSGLQKIVRQARVHGLSAKNSIDILRAPIKFLAYAIAGRALITIDSPSASITLITEEDSNRSRMGIQGISATEAAAGALIESVITAWKNGLIEMVEDSEVGVV